MLRQWILTASVLTGAILLLRLLFRRRIAQRLQYALWLPVLLRLLLPFSLFTAPVSVPAAAERVAPAVFVTAAPRQETVRPAPVPSAPPAATAAPAEIAEPRPAVTPAPAAPASGHPDWSRILRFVWLDGSLALALWLLGVNLGFGNRLRKSRTLFRAGKCPVYVSDAAASPCLFGLFRPAVYLTSAAAELPEEKLEQVLLHERTHLRQGDTVWGLLRCLCLAVWWWNPLVWLAAACSRRDGELSCDEKVLRTLGEDKRLDYGHTLVDLLPRKTPGALLCAATVSGGGKAMKERLERIVKKPRVWVIAAILAVLLTAFIVGCSFGGKGEGDPSGPSPSASPEPTAAAEPEKTWQEQYRDLLRRLLEDETLYEPIGGGPVLSFELLDLSGNGIPELVLYFHGAEQTHAAAVVTLEEGELRCMNRELTLGLPPAENAVDRLFIANPGVYESEVGRNAFFRYYCQTDDGDGRIGEGFYLLDSASGVECESWGDWILFGHDERGYLRCETRLSWELHCDLESFAEVYWEIDGEETSAEEYHAAMDAFDAWLGQYRCLTETGECCVVFHDESDPLAAIDRALAAWTPLPSGSPAPAESPAPGEFTPVTEFMGRDWLTLPEGARWLAEEELSGWEAWFAEDWMRGQFLVPVYEKPEDVDLYELFYNGVDPEGHRSGDIRDFTGLNPITPEDKQLYVEHLGEWTTDRPTYKIPKAQMEAVLQKYLGLSLEETNRIHLSLPYLPWTDSYYHTHWDTNLFLPHVLYGYALEDEIALFYVGYGTYYGEEYRHGYDMKHSVCRVILRREEADVHFRSKLLAFTDGTEVVYDPPQLAPSVPEMRPAGFYGLDITRIRGDLLEQAPETEPAAAWEKPGYGTLYYGENGDEPVLWFVTEQGKVWQLPTPETAAGKPRLDETGEGAESGTGFILNAEDDPDLISWWMDCPRETTLDTHGMNVRWGGRARWTLYLPKMEIYVYFRPEEGRGEEPAEPGSPEWLEWCLGGEELSAELWVTGPDAEMKTIALSGAQCRSILSDCTWERGAVEDGASAPEYRFTLRGPGTELTLYQGRSDAVLHVDGQETLYRVAGAAERLRRECFDPAESSAATSAIRADASEEDPALAYVLKLCEAMKNLSPGSSWGIQDYEVRGVASEEHKAQQELALHTIVYILPNEWNSVPWWAGAGMEPAAGDYEGWLIMDVYYLLELEDGAWRYKDSAQYAPGWGSLELEHLDNPPPEPAPEPTPEPIPAPTPEPAAWRELTREDGFAWLEGLGDIRPLSPEELESWAQWFRDDRFRLQFLTSAYAQPREVDLNELFYNGVPGDWQLFARDIRTLLARLGGWIWATDTDVLPRSEMDAALRQYLGLGLEETDRIRLTWPYLPETDCYYHAHGDTNGVSDIIFPFLCGYAQGDRVFLFYDGWSAPYFGSEYQLGYTYKSGIYRVELKLEGENGYDRHFVSNLRMLTDGRDVAAEAPQPGAPAPENGAGAEGDVTVLTLIPESFESAEAAREYVESLAFIVGDGNGGEADRYPIEILLEQNYPGYGTLIYGEIPTGTVHGSNPLLYFIGEDGRLFRLPIPLGGSNIRMERDGRYSADEGSGFRIQESRGDMVCWWMRTAWETNLCPPADAWTGGENKVVSSGSAAWTLYLPTMEVFLLYEPEG